MTKLHKKTVVTISVICIILVGLLGIILIATRDYRGASKLFTFSKTGIQDFSMGYIDANAIKTKSENFDFANSENIAKVEFVSIEQRSYLYNMLTDDIIILNSELTSDERLRYIEMDYVQITDDVFTLRIVDSLKGDYNNGYMINLRLNQRVEDTKKWFGNDFETVLGFKKSNQDNLFELDDYNLSVLYCYDDRIYPYFDMTYEELFGEALKGYDNPVGKYKGMKESNFIKEITKQK